jgi:cytochrome c oxidase assembly protein subunit 17
VCKEEKSKRDECMLFSNAKDPAADCRSMVDLYKKCMAGYGFAV